MSNTQFTTPGPWYAVEYAGFYEIQDSPDYEGIIITDVEKVGYDIADRNARLMALAPQLLEALKNLSDNVKSLDDIRELPIMRRLLKISDEVIKKATE